MVIGFAVIDKPSGMTSHDVVARLRRLLGTRKIGHAGTLDPMATGVLVAAVGVATRALTYLTGADKEYTATIRLGESTTTDDAEGEVVTAKSAALVDLPALHAAMARLTGEIDQVPSTVSAIKVNGRRAYARVRAGEQVELAARRVTVRQFALLDSHRPAADLFDLDVLVECSTGTYIRALARDLGEALGTGGHLTALRRTRVGPFSLDAAAPLGDTAPDLLPLPDVLRSLMPVREVTDEEAGRLANGGRLAPRDAERAPVEPSDGAGDGVREGAAEPTPYAAIDPAGRAVAIMRDRDGAGRPEVVFPPVG